MSDDRYADGPEQPPELPRVRVSWRENKPVDANEIQAFADEFAKKFGVRKGKGRERLQKRGMGE